MSVHWSNHIDRMALALGSTAPVLVGEGVVVADVEDNACRWKSQSEEVEVVQQTCVMGNTFLAVGGSYSDTALADKNKLEPMGEYCDMRTAPEEQASPCWLVKLEKEFWVRSMRKQSCKKSGSHRSELTIPGN